MSILRLPCKDCSSSSLNEDPSHRQSEDQTTDQQVLRPDKSAAGILCALETCYGIKASHLTLTKDVLGYAAFLGKVDNENLNRILSEYPGVQNMLAIVCRTYESIKALEMYKKDGSIESAWFCCFYGLKV